MRKHQGLTLIELIVFIVVVGVVISGSMRAFNTILFYSNKPAQRLTASQLADARMNLIVLQRRVNGLAGMSDPCSSGSLAACTGLSNFAANGGRPLSNEGYVVSSSITAISGGARTATVIVCEKSNAACDTNSQKKLAVIVARFVQ